MVLFGVTGDLARKKLMPAIYDLANRGLLPPGFSLVGFARRDWADQDFGKIVYESVRERARTPFREEVWRTLAEGLRFVPGTFDDDAAFDNLAKTIEDLDHIRGTAGNHAFYLSIPPAAFPVVIKQLAHHLGEGRRRDRQVERVVAVRAAFAVEGLDGAPQLGERLLVVERALHKADALGELLPRLLAEWRARVLLDGVVHHLREVLLVPVAARKAREGERRGKQAAVGQVVDRGHELLAREVAGHAEHHEAARAGDAWQAAIAWIAQGIVHFSPSESPPRVQSAPRRSG